MGDLKGHVDEVRKELDIFKQSEGAAEAVKIVVSGIFAIQTTVGSGMRDVVVVTCEGVPALFTFTLTPQPAYTPPNPTPTGKRPRNLSHPSNIQTPRIHR